jgi:biotin carboxyl carrier protein
MNYTVTIEESSSKERSPKKRSLTERSFQVSIEESKEGLHVALDDQLQKVDMAKVAPEVYSLLVNGRSHEVQVRGDAGGYQVFYGSRHYQVTVEGQRARLMKSLVSTAQAHERPREIKAAMPGLVVKVEVAEGDRVQAGDGLVVVEAMKMENEIRAQRQGVVKQIFIKKGMTVDQGQTLVILE